MLAGRKLLLADDSITIQKVVELTFADEGVQVIAVGTGTEAIERLEEISPDVVLADVFMPGMTGYQVCEHIKLNERLKHIPVMLLVGSFEPFDEAEAHRVGADDTLTKPFQSIRNLVDRVTGLLRGEKAAQSLDVVAPDLPGTHEADDVSHVDLTESQTAELPKVEVIDDQRLGTDELELTTADTRQLSPEMLADTQPMEFAEDHTIEIDPEGNMETEHQVVTVVKHEGALEFGDVLLDLGRFEPTSAMFGSDDAILDIDLDSPAPERPRAVSVQPGGRSVAVVETEAVMASPFADTIEWETVRDTQAFEIAAPAVSEESEPGPELVTEAVEDSAPQAEVRQAPVAVVVEPAANPTGQVTMDQLAPEVIEAIAHRVVAQLSEKAVQEIAWEVVPQLAELLIKRKLEEKEPQTH